MKGLTFKFCRPKRFFLFFFVFFLFLFFLFLFFLVAGCFYANSVDPDETAHNEPSHQDLHCLPFWSALIRSALVMNETPS